MFRRIIAWKYGPFIWAATLFLHGLGSKYRPWLGRRISDSATKPRGLGGDCRVKDFLWSFVMDPWWGLFYGPHLVYTIMGILGAHAKGRWHGLKCFRD